MDFKCPTSAKMLEILKKNEDTEDVEVTKVDLKSGAEKGQNYSGQVVACHVEAKVQGQPKTYHWMAKVPLRDPSRFEWLRMSFMEQKELGFYQNLLPALKDLIAKKGSDIKLTFCPFVYGEFNEDTAKEECESGSLIIMEHLTHMGYTEAINKRSGLDLAHVKLVMKSLGEFHAASRAYYKTKHGSLKNMLAKEPIQARDFYGANPTDAMAVLMDKFSDTFQKGFHETLLNIGEDGHKYVNSFKRFTKDVIDPIKLRDQLGGPDICKFNVLCHGDLWFNNILFKYEGQRPTEVCLVDLALTKWASPTIDLSYFLLTSTSPELRKDHMDEILECYHQSLTRALKALGEDPSDFTFSELKADYKKCSFYGFIMTLLILPLILVKKEDAMDLEDISGDLNDPDVIEKINQNTITRTNMAMSSEPQIGDRISSAFREMVDNGYFIM